MIIFLLFVLLGILVGIIFGIIPGLHPNFLILFAPLLFSLFASSENLIGFVVAMSVANAISDFVPSILFGAPEEGTELSVTPGHRMLLKGYGYQAVKLAVTGCMFSVVVICALLPAIIVIFPFIYSTIQPFLFFVLIAASLYMILTEKSIEKIFTSGICFLLAGIIGISLHNIPLDSSLTLFPVLSGLFGAAILIMQFKQKVTHIPKQKPDVYVSSRLVKRSVLFGSLGGIFSGILPGIGPSQIASVATVDKNEKSFLITLGALATSNIIISILSLWLIGKARSGASVIIANFAVLDINTVMLILFVALFAGAVATLTTLKLAKSFLSIIDKINYITISKIIFLIIITAVFLATGFYGLIIFGICTSLGLFAYTSKIKMSCLMAVLLLPTIIYYYPL